MTQSRKIIGLCLAAAIGAIGYYLYLGSAVPVGQRPLTRIEAANFGELRAAFNEEKDSVRVVTLLSPT